VLLSKVVLTSSEISYVVVNLMLFTIMMQYLKLFDLNLVKGIRWC